LLFEFRTQSKTSTDPTIAPVGSSSGSSLSFRRLVALDLERCLNQKATAIVRAHRPVLDILTEVKNRIRPRLTNRNRSLFV